MRFGATLPVLAGLAMAAGCGVPAPAPVHLRDIQNQQQPNEQVGQQPEAQRQGGGGQGAPVREAPPGPRARQPERQPGGPPEQPGRQPERRPGYRQPIGYVPIVTQPGYTIVPQAQVQITEGATAGSTVTIQVAPDGSASFRTPKTAGFGQVARNLANLLFSDVQAALPLETLGVASTCTPSAQSVYVTYQGQTSPDLSCSTQAQGQNLVSDAAQITSALGLTLPGTGS